MQASDRTATGVRSTYQRRSGTTRPPSIKTAKGDKREIKYSAFLITVNTNMSVDDDDEADEWGARFTEALDEIGYNGASCSTWGKFFRVNVGRGKKWLDKKGTVPNPKYNPEYNSFYENDDKQGIDHWCSLIESMHIEGAGVEWAPGTKNGKNQYLHAHIFVKIAHRTRLLVDRDYVASYFHERLHLPHKPYVHVDVIRDNTAKVLEYVTKNAWNKNSSTVQDHAQAFFIGHD